MNARCVPERVPSLDSWGDAPFPGVPVRAGLKERYIIQLRQNILLRQYKMHSRTKAFRRLFIWGPTPRGSFDCQQCGHPGRTHRRARASDAGRNLHLVWAFSSKEFTKRLGCLLASGTVMAFRQKHLILCVLQVLRLRNWDTPGWLW